MKRLVLLAAVATLGSGCIVHDCDTPSITVEWSSFVGGDGLARACVDAGVSYVDIYLDGAFVDSWNCTDGGAVITSVPSGTHRLTVEGVESAGRIAYRDDFDVNAASCGDHLVQAQPAEGWVDVNYAFQGGGSCVGTVQNPSYMWFSVFDTVANLVVAEVSEKTPLVDETQYWCGVYANDPNPSLAAHALFIPLPAGTYTMRWIEEHTSPFSGLNYGVVGANCTPFDFTVPRGTTATLPTPPVVLADTSTICTHP
jgi:hypothetical protein